MKKINYFSDRLLSKIAALFICVMIFFNCISAFPSSDINVSGVLDIQKDVFSAVLFVSESISKLSQSFSDRLLSHSEAAKSDAEKKTEHAKAFVKKDFILIKSESKNKQNEKSRGIISLNGKESVAISTADRLSSIVLQVDRSIVFIFLILMIFYISSKRPKDAAVYYCRKYIFV